MESNNQTQHNTKALATLIQRLNVIFMNNRDSNEQDPQKKRRQEYLKGLLNSVGNPEEQERLVTLAKERNAVRKRQYQAIKHQAKISAWVGVSALILGGATLFWMKVGQEYLSAEALDQISSIVVLGLFPVLFVAATLTSVWNTKADQVLYGLKIKKEVSSDELVADALTPWGLIIEQEDSEGINRLTLDEGLDLSEYAQEHPLCHEYLQGIICSGMTLSYIDYLVCDELVGVSEDSEQYATKSTVTASPMEPSYSELTNNSNCVWFDPDDLESTMKGLKQVLIKPFGMVKMQAQTDPEDEDI